MLKRLKYQNGKRATLMTKLKERLSPRSALLIFELGFVFIWLYYLIQGWGSFNEDNAVSIYGTIVQGMSALLSVSIAVVVFRIQSLENRLHSLEDSVINYVFQITHFIYPKWLPVLEEHIRNGLITNRYYEEMRTMPDRIGMRTPSNLKQDRNNQQDRLSSSLEEHANIEKTISETKKGAYWSFILLLLPIIACFVMFMISDTYSGQQSYISVSLTLLLSGLGAISLIYTVATSLQAK